MEQAGAPPVRSVRSTRRTQGRELRAAFRDTTAWVPRPPEEEPRRGGALHGDRECSIRTLPSIYDANEFD